MTCRRVGQAESARPAVAPFGLCVSRIKSVNRQPQSNTVFWMVDPLFWAFLWVGDQSAVDAHPIRGNNTHKLCGFGGGDVTPGAGPTRLGEVRSVLESRTVDGTEDFLRGGLALRKTGLR